MLHHGIFNKSSCVYTIAQNKVAKRKNRHLLEVACALLFQMTVPKQFWADDVSTTCYSPQLHRYLVSRDVTFHEDLPYFPVITYCHQEENDDLLVYVSPSPVATIERPPIKVYTRRPQMTSSIDREPSSQREDSPIDAPNDAPNDVPLSAPSEAHSDSNALSDASYGFDLPPLSDTLEHDLPIALQKGKRAYTYSVSAFISYDNLSISFRAFVTNLDAILVPKTIGETLAHPGWRAVMIEEMNALDHNGTWALVDLPARLVAKGYTQTYAPVAKISSILLFISLVVTYNWVLHRLDVKNSFLHGDLQEEVYIKQSSGFVTQGDPGRDGYLKGTLGLGILYANHGHHIGEGFTDDDYSGCTNTSRSTKGVWDSREVIRLRDPKLKLLGEKGIKFIFVGYAKHLKVFRFYGIFDENRFSSVPRPSQRSLISGTKDISGSMVPKDVTEEDDPKTFDEAINDEMDSILGNNTWVLADLPPGCKPLCCKWIFKRKLKIIQQMDVKTAFLNVELDEEVYMNQPWGFIIPGNVDDILVSNPMDTSEKLMPNNGQAVSQLKYSKVIGSLMYAMTCIRPDIALEVGKLSRYTSNPSTLHWQAIQRVLKYLNKTIDYTLVYIGYPSLLEGYTDASWISNTKDNSSTTGGVFLLGGGAIC
nr:zinc finger, CCHC-type [Tanacetum cinerariifolium]